MDASRLRVWWAHRQGLDGRLAGQSAAEVLAATGWARSVGGSNPYLTLFSRAGLSRSAIDTAVSELAIHELPAARGCTYVVPAADFALALKVGQGTGEAAEMKTALKLGVTEVEIEQLCEAIRHALKSGPLDTDALKSAIGDAGRSLGPEGAKKGLTSTMPVGLGLLQAQGEIRRIPVNGRLDQQKYRYARWSPNPLAKDRRSKEECLRELAARYFRWIGPATMAEWQWFSGLSGKAAKPAVADLGLVPLEPGSDRLLFPEDLDAMQSMKLPKAESIALVSSLDSHLLLRRNVRDLLADEDAGREVPAEKGIKSAGSLTELSSNGIFDRGRLIGLWEYDVATSSVAWSTFSKPGKEVKAAVQRMEQFVREELGDARSFSLDSPKSRAPRIEALRAAAHA